MKITGSDIHLLKVFDSVVRNNGFTAAQVELGLSQPTISNHITALEERLGVKLCQRGRRGFLLTDKGRMVHEIGQTLMQTLDGHSTRLAELKGNLVGRLNIAVVDCTATDPDFRLPRAIRELAARAPAVRVNLRIAGPQDILNSVMDGSCHIGIGSFDNIVNGLRIADLYEERHALCCAPGHPLFDLPDARITESELRRHPWVHRGYWSQQRQKSVNRSDLDLFVQEIEAQLMLVLSGVYLGLLPEHLAASFLREGRLRMLPPAGEVYTCKIQMVTRSGRLPNVNELFMEILTACYP